MWYRTEKAFKSRNSRNRYFHARAQASALEVSAARRKFAALLRVMFYLLLIVFVVYLFVPKNSKQKDVQKKTVKTAQTFLGNVRLTF